MEKPIYKLFMSKPKEAWYQLSEEEKKNLQLKLNDALEKVGGKSIISCFSGWSSERWPFFSVEEFPSIEAVGELTPALFELNAGRYFETESLLGIRMEN